MFLPQTVIDRIRAAIGERISPMPSCPLCRHLEWQMTDGVVVPQIRESLGASAASRRLLMVAISCGHCGNTLFLNMENLGLGALLAELGANLVEDHLDV